MATQKTIPALTGPNEAYIVELYERYLHDPSSVPPEWQQFFRYWAPAAALGRSGVPEAVTPPVELRRKIVAAHQLANAIRQFGLLAARLDPLGSEPPGDPALRLETYGLTEDDLANLPSDIAGGPVAQRTTTMLEAVEALRAIYCGTIGYDFEHIHVPEEREWLRAVVEEGRFTPKHDPINERALLERLTQVEVFERFLHRTFPGRTRFSIEGLDMLVPMLDEIIGGAAESGYRHIVLGMAHRGRLNVLAHNLNKPYEEILTEFYGSEPLPAAAIEAAEEGYTGDVKYHLGARRAVDGGEAVEMQVTLAPNPSHLEFVNPVVLGMARAEQTERHHPGRPTLYPVRALPVLIHGDAAFIGEGISAETLNLSRLTGYWVGGTLHIIANNQVGFTTDPHMGRSTLFASDLAKGFKMPIVHVNADDPLACLTAVRLAMAYRRQFRKDFVIDLIGYRRWGHNEGDDPTFTQPLLYKKIKHHPTVRTLWVQHMVAHGTLTQEEADALEQAYMERLQTLWNTIRERDIKHDVPEPVKPGRFGPIDTAVPLETLRDLNRALFTVPDDFNIHPRLARIVKRWRAALEPDGDGMVEWAHAETLAFASILADGTPVRLTGQDSERGTFSQRHLVWHDQETGRRYTPMQALPHANASFEVYNSPLSEAGVLGFEYGYDVQAPDALVLWEAQYGDFVNVAQVIIDQFILSAKVKWHQTPALVMLLPHGYEGAGPEHSSARLERFLQQAAQGNVRVVNCTTAAQYFHLLRRQANLLHLDPRPLIVMTPKSLLRHPLARSHVSDLAQGTFQTVIQDDVALQRADRVRRLILCSGHIYVDLVSAEQYASADHVAIVRVEQLYPFPAEELRTVVAAYPNLEDVCWVQEEPQNMGAWEYMFPRLAEHVLPDGMPLCYIGRPRWASPAEGAPEWHAREQARIIAEAFQNSEDGEV